MGIGRVNKGYKVCPHCGGETKCSCSTCGKETTTRAGGAGARWTEAGLCQACHGQGQLPDPDYRPEPTSSTQGSSGCLVIVALLLPLIGIFFAYRGSL